MLFRSKLHQTSSESELLLSNGHSPQIRENGELLVRMCRMRVSFFQKWSLANVGEFGESEQNRLANVGEFIESEQNRLGNVGEWPLLSYCSFYLNLINENLKNVCRNSSFSDKVALLLNWNYHLDRWFYSITSKPFPFYEITQQFQLPIIFLHCHINLLRPNIFSFYFISES